MVVRLHESLEELEYRSDLKVYAPIRDRIRAVILPAQRHQAPAIAHRLHRSRRWVQQWVYRYRDQGFEGLQDKPRPGQPPKLPKDQETVFRQRLEAGPRPEDGVCRLAGREVHRILTQEFGADYSLAGAYRLLHRLGYACLKPRPKHRKGDPC